MLRPAFTPEAWEIMEQILRLGFSVEICWPEGYAFRNTQGCVTVYDALGDYITEFGPRDRRTVPTVEHLRKALAAAKEEAAKYDE